MTEVIDVGINRVEVSERRSEGSQTESDEADTEKGYDLAWLDRDDGVEAVVPDVWTFSSSSLSS